MAGFQTLLLHWHSILFSTLQFTCHTGLDKQILSIKLSIFSFQSVSTYVLGAQKNYLIETVPLSTHNIHFGW